MRSSPVVVVLASPSSITSAWCSAEVGMALLLNKPILCFSIAEGVRAHPLLGISQMWPLGDDPNKLVDLVARHSSPTSEVSIGGLDKPYPGLRPLMDHEEGLLFGRSEILTRIVGDLDPMLVPPSRIIIVSGGSGSGKSSLIRSGVVPALRRAGWTIEGPTQPQVLTEAGIPSTSPNSRRLVVVDQAEELLILSNQSRQDLADWFGRWIVGDGSMIVVVRSEFRDEVAAMLPEIIEPTDCYVSDLNKAGIEEAIRGPARQFQLHIEEDLVRVLVDETGSGTALPLLAYTLEILWQRRDREHNALLAETLLELGGVSGILESQAQQALHRASGGDPERRRETLAALTQLASPVTNPPTRRPVPERNLTDTEQEYLEHFRATGVIVKRTSHSLSDAVDVGFRPEGDDLIDVASESIFS